MKIELLKRLLLLLGFSAALSACDGIGADEYGCPYAEFSLKGKVTDVRGAPIRGIKVEMTAEHDPVIALTDEEGRYELRYEGVNRLTGELAVTATDTDGPDNGGEFATGTRTVTVSGDDYKGADGSWFQGKAEAELDFQLEPKQEPEPAGL